MAKRTYTWNGTVGPFININSAENVVDFLEEDETNEAYISISSNGGDANVADAIIGKLSPYKKRIKVEALGLVASAASHIAFSIADKLYARGNSKIMIHNGRINGLSLQTGTKEELERRADSLRMLDENLAKAVINKTGLEKEKVEEYMLSEKKFNSEDALKIGLIDEIIPADEKFTEAQIKEIEYALVNEEVPEKNNKVKSNPKEVSMDNETKTTDAVKEQAEETTEEVVTKETEQVFITDNAKANAELQRLRTQNDFLMKQQEALVLKANAAHENLSARKKEIEAEKNNTAIQEAISKGKINSEEEIQNWKTILAQGGENARNTLAALTPDIYAQEFGVDFSETVEAVPQEFIKIMKKVGEKEIDIPQLWKDAKIQERAANAIAEGGIN